MNSNRVGLPVDVKKTAPAVNKQERGQSLKHMRDGILAITGWILVPSISSRSFQTVEYESVNLFQNFLTALNVTNDAKKKAVTPLC